MSQEPLFRAHNQHVPSCGVPAEIVAPGDGRVYHGYFENRYGEQWVFFYDHESQRGTLQGGDIGWGQAVEVREGRVHLSLDSDEKGWLEMCWRAATRPESERS